MNLNAEAFAGQARIASAKDFSGLTKLAISLLKKEQHEAESIRVDGRLVYLPSSGKAIIIGDLHGDLESLTHILNDSGFIEKIRKGENIYLVFLGDYADRGSASVEVFYFVLKLKTSFPNNVILMRGNHEGPEDMPVFPHDLPDKLKQKYGDETGAKNYVELRRVFNYLYNAVVIDEWALLIHGGLPSEALSLQDLAYAHIKHPQKSHLEEMLWSDPQEIVNGTQPSPRGAGKMFGVNITRKILKRLHAKILIRGHEPCQEGFKISHNGMILTIFSTNKPPYINKHAAYLQLNLSRKIDNAKQLKRYVKQF